MTITAPAHQICGPWRGRPSDPVTKVGFGSGTSYATASVAGIAALWLSHFGRQNLINRVGRGNLQAFFRYKLRQSARCPEGWDTNHWGAGIVDAEALLKAGISLDGFEPPEPEPLPSRRETLLAQGVDPALVATLSDPEIEKFASELIWRTWHLAKDPAAAPPMSRHLARACTKGSGADD